METAFSTADLGLYPFEGIWRMAIDMESEFEWTPNPGQSRYDNDFSCLSQPMYETTNRIPNNRNVSSKLV